MAFQSLFLLFQDLSNLVLKLLKHGIPAQAIFYDLYLEKSDGEFSQIDLVVAAKTGIIEIKVKDYSGWIFGNKHIENINDMLVKHRIFN